MTPTCALWKTYGVNSWPTLVLIDPEGKIVGYAQGETPEDKLDKAISDLIRIHKAKRTLNEKPLKFQLAKENGESPLFFPGKVLADGPGKRLFIADSTHHRIVITDLDGKKIAVAGTGQPGMTNGAFDRAQFNDPQGMTLDGNTLYVADNKNHLIRALDLKAQTVTTIAGTGLPGQNRYAIGPALKISLSSPWDLVKKDNLLFIAMAGFNQIWVCDLSKQLVGPFAGMGREDIINGTLAKAQFRAAERLDDRRHAVVRRRQRRQRDTQSTAQRQGHSENVDRRRFVRLRRRGLQSGELHGPGFWSSVHLSLAAPSGPHLRRRQTVHRGHLQ